MKASNTLIEKIKEFEGLRKKAYKCAAGVLTCGYGHTKGVKATTVCTKSAAEEWLLQDLAPIEKHLSTMQGLDTQFKFDAIADFCFNLGTAAYDGSTLRKKIEGRASEAEIRAEFARWVHGGKKVLPGLVKRREWEADRFFKR